jgi:hypothetical protein
MSTGVSVFLDGKRIILSQTARPFWTCISFENFR